MGYKNYINDEHKIRISLSKRAYIVMNDDMRIFSITKPATFINIIIENFRDTAKASLSIYLTRRRHEFEELFLTSKLDTPSQAAAIEHLLENEKQKISLELKNYLNEKYICKLYHINNANFDYLTSDFCYDEEFYNYKAGTYIKCILEEYAHLPFIERERIFKKDVYDVIEYACKMNYLLQIKTQVYGQEQTFVVYPYKIIADPLHTQAYLACFTRKPQESPKTKIDASFSMARLEKPVVLKQHAFLSKEDIKKIEDDITKLSVPYLLGTSQEIRVRLSERGKKAYQTRLYARPDKDETLSTNNEYVFFCSEQQAYYYFLSFGAEAEIISPPSLRDRIQKNSQRVLQLYT